MGGAAAPRCDRELHGAHNVATRPSARLSRRALTLPEGPRILDCETFMDEPRLSRATHTSEFWALARGA
eukprot:2122135-Prymnesium_polylepis.1